MTAPDPRHATSTDALTPVRQRIAPLLGEDVARRLRSFRNGVLYIDPPFWRAFLAWLIDVIVVVGTALGLGLAVLRSSSPPDPVPGAVASVVVLLLLIPFVYAWFYRNGRALGGLLTGTRLVRIKDGGRIGWAKAGWAMLVRVLFIPFFLLTFFESGPAADVSPVRTSIDDPATRRIRAAGIAPPC